MQTGTIWRLSRSVGRGRSTHQNVEQGGNHEEVYHGRIRQNIGAVFMNAVILEIVDDNKKEILASEDHELIAELFISKGILSELVEGGRG